MDTAPPDPSLRFRYDFTIGVVLGSARAKKHLHVLIARTTLDEVDAKRLADVQLAKWYCDDIADDIALRITLFIPENADAVRNVFDRLGVEYEVVGALDERNAVKISAEALARDCDLVVSADSDAVTNILKDEVMLVGDDVEAVLHAIEIHLKGFDVPWSFVTPIKNQQWTMFYVLGESNGQQLYQEMNESAQAKAEVAEVMRSLVVDSIPSLCFNRDRIGFYRQQDRWAERNNIERQDFRFEYTNALNLFYLTLYSAVDQVVALVVHFYSLPVDEKDQGAGYGAFTKARKTVPGLDKVFSDAEFDEMYKIPRLIRHKAAHRGPITPQTLYFGADEYIDEQLDAAAEEHGFYEDLRVLEALPFPLPDVIRDHLISLACHKAKLKLLGDPAKHLIYLEDKTGAFFYHPDPAGNLANFFAFLERVLALIRPWNKMNAPTTA
jgi:hypothetical protein